MGWPHISRLHTHTHTHTFPHNSRSIKCNSTKTKDVIQTLSINAHKKETRRLRTFVTMESSCVESRLFFLIYYTKYETVIRSLRQVIFQLVNPRANMETPKLFVDLVENFYIPRDKRIFRRNMSK